MSDVKLNADKTGQKSGLISALLPKCF